MIPKERIAAEIAEALARVRPSPSPVRDWFREHLLAPLDRLLRGVVEALLVHAGPWFGYALLALAGLAALGLLAYLAVWLFRREEGKRRAAAGIQAKGAERGGADPDAAEHEAARLAAAGDFAGAVRMLYLAAVVRLHRRAGRPFDASLTPGEHLRGFRAAPFFSALRAFVREYERVSFGARALDPQGYGRVAGLRPGEARR